MSDYSEENTIFILTRDEILACASELGIPNSGITSEVMAVVRQKIRARFSDWPDIVKDALLEATTCPLNLPCWPSCYWWQNGQCIMPPARPKDDG